MNFNRVTIVVIICVGLTSFAQAQPSFIEPYKIGISCNKTTHLIFPFPIKSVDRGSLDVLAQKSPGADEVLQLKADHPRIAQTNVTVITADNKLYSFLVLYDSMPQHLTISFDSTFPAFDNSVQTTNRNTTKLKMDEQPNLRALKEEAAIIGGKKKPLLHLHVSHGSMMARLTGIYIKNDVYYFSFRIHNRSNVSFSLGSVSFTIRDTKRIKRKASQELSIQPLLQYGTEGAVKGDEQSTWVIALPKFTLEDKKHLYIQILEQDGGRNLSLEVRNKPLLAAKRL